MKCIVCQVNVLLMHTLDLAPPRSAIYYKIKGFSMHR